MIWGVRLRFLDLALVLGDAAGSSPLKPKEGLNGPPFRDSEVLSHLAVLFPPSAERGLDNAIGPCPQCVLRQQDDARGFRRAAQLLIQCGQGEALPQGEVQVGRAVSG